MRLLATILNLSLLGGLAWAVLAHDGIWRTQEYVATFVIVGAGLSNLAVLFFDTHIPWATFHLRRE